MNIGRKLNLTHGFMAVFVIVLLFGANTVLKNFERDFASLAEQTLELTRELENMRAAGLRIVASTAEYTLLSKYGAAEGSAAQEDLEEIERGTELYQTAFGRYSQIIDQFFPNEASYRDAIGEAGAALIAGSRLLVDLALKDAPQAILVEQKEALDALEGSYLVH